MRTGPAEGLRQFAKAAKRVSREVRKFETAIERVRPRRRRCATCGAFKPEGPCWKCGNTRETLVEPTGQDHRFRCGSCGSYIRTTGMTLYYRRPTDQHAFAAKGTCKRCGPGVDIIGWDLDQQLSLKMEIARAFGVPPAFMPGQK